MKNSFKRDLAYLVRRIEDAKLDIWLIPVIPMIFGNKYLGMHELAKNAVEFIFSNPPTCPRCAQQFHRSLRALGFDAVIIRKGHYVILSCTDLAAMENTMAVSFSRE